MKFEKNKVYWSWVYFMVDNIKAHKYEMEDTLSHNKPYYISGKPLLSCFGFTGKDGALEFTEDVLFKAGYNPGDYNLNIVEWDDKERSFITSITVKGE